MTTEPEAIEYIVPLAVSSDELLKYYRGVARQIVARAKNGQMISFPVDSLKPFVTFNGVHGVFSVKVNRANKLLSVQQLS